MNFSAVLSQTGCKDTHFFLTCKFFQVFLKYFYTFASRNPWQAHKNDQFVANISCLCENRSIHHRWRHSDDCCHKKRTRREKMAERRGLHRYNNPCTDCPRPVCRKYFHIDRTQTTWNKGQRGGNDSKLPSSVSDYPSCGDILHILQGQ